MKGVIFTEFLEFVERQFGADVAMQVQAAGPEAGGYSAVGQYEHQELVDLVDRAASLANLQRREILRRFGTHLFGHFAAMYPAFLVDIDSTLGFLTNIEAAIHGELRKLYPDAEFPSFECSSPGRGHLQMVYRSRRGFADLAEGLILGCAAHFGEEFDLDREDLPSDGGQAVRFSLASR